MVAVGQESDDRRTGVLFVLDSFPGPNAGTESQLWLLLQRLDRCRFRPAVMLLERSEFLEEHLPEIPKFVVGERRLGSARFWSAAWRAIRAARRDGYSVAHVWFNDCAIALPIPLRIAGFRVIVSRRDLGFWYTRANLPLLRFNARFVDLAICNADAVRENVIAREGYPERKVRVVYNGTAHTPRGVDRDGFRRRWGIPREATLACIVANLRPLKRVGDAIEALALIASQDLSVHLAVAGEDRSGVAGSHQGELEELATRLSVRERVHFLGAVPDPMPLLESADIGVLCSETEGLSNALVEYLAAGLPAVCTPVGGNLEVVQPDVTGLVVPVGDPVALAEAVGRLAGNPALRRNMGTAGRRTARERFSSEAALAAHEAVYFGYRGCVTSNPVGTPRRV